MATYDANGTHFALNDWVGTKRVQTSAAGETELNCMSLPFGDTQSCYAPNGAMDATEHHFTGKERDPESGDDYFLTRYFASLTGRSLSPDDGSDQDSDDPQSWNLYAYGRNNPLTNSDPDGHAVVICQQVGAGLSCATVDNDRYEKAAADLNPGLKVPTLDQVGTNGDGNGKFNATAITDSNGNVVGSATYVSDGNLDYYAHAASYQQLAGAYRVVNAVAGAELTAASFVSTPAAIAVAVEGCNSADASCAGNVALSGVGAFGRGLTGTKLATTVAEQLALEEVAANPSGDKTLANIVLKGSRWATSDGWVKKELRSPGGVVVQWVYNTITGAFDDVKLK